MLLSKWSGFKCVKTSTENHFLVDILKCNDWLSIHLTNNSSHQTIYQWFLTKHDKLLRFRAKDDGIFERLSFDILINLLLNIISKIDRSSPLFHRRFQRITVGKIPSLWCNITQAPFIISSLHLSSCTKKVTV